MLYITLKITLLKKKMKRKLELRIDEIRKNDINLPRYIISNVKFQKILTIPPIK